MRISTLLLLCALVACGDRSTRVTRSASDSTLSPATSLTDAQRQATEDSVKAWLDYVRDRWEHSDSAALIQTYLPTGSLVSVSNGQLQTSRDSAAAGLAGLTQITDKKNSFDDPKIDVLAPGVAVVTLRATFSGKKQGKPFEDRGLWTGVLAQRDGHLRVVQEHYSSVPAAKK